MRPIDTFRTAALVLMFLAPTALRAKEAGETPWRISGDLSEACSCSVPCSCNFGEGPSPEHYCWGLFSLDIQQGSYGKTQLDGLRLAGALGAKGFVMYLDDRATPAQTEALRAIGSDITGKFLANLAAMNPKAAADPSMKLLGFKTIRIVQEVGPKSQRLMIGNLGGFEGDHIIGIDGKTPLRVENNWSWNITQCVKGKTKRLYYKDEFGNEYDLKATNANQGKYDWSDKTPVYFR